MGGGGRPGWGLSRHSAQKACMYHRGRGERELESLVGPNPTLPHDILVRACFLGEEEEADDDDEDDDDEEEGES